MKQFNKYIVLFVIALMMQFTTGCNDLLDEPAENKSYTGETDYTKSADIIVPMIGVYGNLYSAGWETFPLISVRGDDVNAGGLGDQPDYAETDKFKYNKDYWMYNSLWNGLYQRVFTTYSAIDAFQKYKEGGASAQVADQYVAEAKTVRAFLMFQLSRVWGSVLIPMNDDPTQLLNIELSTKEEVMKFISDEMDGAIAALPDAHPRDRADIPGGVTKHTALAMKALANLELKNYQAVAEACGQIIQSGKFALEPDFYALFKTKGKLNRENIFEWQYSDFGQGSGDRKGYLFGFFGPQNWTPKVAGTTGGGWGFFEPSLKYIKFMLDRGETTRLETSVLFTNRGIATIREDSKYADLPDWISNTTRSGDKLNDFPRALFSSGKQYLPTDEMIPGRTDYGSNKNMPCIRYAEILLMYAEALTNGASASGMTAAQAVNLVRARAGLGALASVTNQQVIDEKFAELAMEWGTRYYDMIRYEKYSELSYDGRTFDPASNIYLPYPQEQVDMLPILKGK